jgi:hypothetical protein
MGPLFTAIVGIILVTVISFPAGFILGFPIRYLYYRIKKIPRGARSNRLKVYIVSSLVSAASIWIIFSGIVIYGQAMLIIHSTDYNKSIGLTDYHRWPLEFPYEMGTTQLYSDADIGMWAKDGSILRGVVEYAKDGHLIMGRCIPKDFSKPHSIIKLRQLADLDLDYFIFDCKTGEYGRFRSFEKLSDTLIMLGIDSLPELKSIEWHYKKHLRSR